MSAPVYNVSVDGNNNDSNLILGSANGAIQEDDMHDHNEITNKLAVLENALNVNSASDLAQAALVSGNIESIKELDSKVTANETEHKKLRAFFSKYTNHSGNGLSLKEKENLDNIYIVGNSLVDNGNNSKLIKENGGYWNDNLYPRGRYTNGLAFGDYISMGLGFTPSETKNVAQGGARVTKDRDLYDNNDETIFDGSQNPLQIYSYLKQIQNGISDGEIDSNTLVFISAIGANDLGYFSQGEYGNPTEEASVGSLIQDLVTGISQIASALLTAGVPAKNIIFIGVASFYLTYDQLNTAKSTKSMAGIDQLYQLFKTLNNSVTQTLTSISEDIILIDLDSFGEFVLDIIEAGFDIENTQQYIVAYKNEPINSMDGNYIISVDKFHFNSQIYKYASYIFIDALLDKKGLKFAEFPNKGYSEESIFSRLSNALGISTSFAVRTLDPAPTKQQKALVAAYKTETGNYVSYKGYESINFQNNILEYLRGTPEDCFQWMAGYNMQFFAAKGLLVDITDVWDELGSQYNESFKIASTGLDGKQYFIPSSWYPWGLHYRKSVLAENGINPEDLYNWEGFLGALEKLKSQGLIGLVAADKDGWEAMGTFDMLNARINGYQFHVDLLGGREKWTDSRVKEVFRYWELLLPYQNNDILDLEWDSAMFKLFMRQAGFFMNGSWFGANWLEQSQEDYDDLMIIPFPEINPIHGRDTVDAPIDGYCVAKNGSNNEGGKNLIKFAGDIKGVQAIIDVGIPITSANNGQDRSSFDALQNAQLAMVNDAKYITQFLDRDTRPDFAGQYVGPALQNWFKNPSNIDTILELLQTQWDTLPPL